MPQLRHIATTLAIVVAMLLVLSSVAAAHAGPHPLRFGPHVFDSVWIGTAGDDQHTGTEGDRERILGRAGNDVLDGNDERDVVKGNRGNDVVLGGAASDRIYGNRGNDDMDGGDGPDLVAGGPGADVLDGGDGHDLIKGGSGADTIVATDGVRDWILCGRGKDVVTADTVDRVHRSCEDVTRIAPQADE